MLKPIAIASALLWSLSSHAGTTTYWTVKIDGGIHVTNKGVAAINLGKHRPTNPNPKGARWKACKSNWVYFHNTAEGKKVADKYVERMLAVAMSAYKTESRVRLAIKRDKKNYCYTSQIFDQN